MVNEAAHLLCAQFEGQHQVLHETCTLSVAQATLTLASVSASWGARHVVTTGCPFILCAAFSSQILSETPEAAGSQLFFLSPRAGRGNTCSVAAAFKKGEDDNGSLTVCLQNMGKDTKVREFVHF